MRTVGANPKEGGDDGDTQVIVKNAREARAYGVQWVIRYRVAKQLLQAKDTMKNQADARRTFRELKVGELVMVNSRYFTMRKPATGKKFCLLFVGPYRVVERIGASAHRVDLPVSCKAHNVLHVSKLWKYYPSDRTAKVPEPVYIEDLEAFEAQRILNKRVTKKTVHYLVQWKNQDCSHNT